MSTNKNKTAYKYMTRKNVLNKLDEYSENRFLINRAIHAFEPTEAYYIMGHGGTTSETFKVPDDCVVVVKVEEGDKFYQRDKYIPMMCNIDMSILTDPLRHRADITRALGSVAIYPPGSMCPNFTYSVIDAIRTEPHRVLSEFGSGVTHLGEFKDDHHKCALQHTLAHDTITRFREIKERKNSEEIKQFIANAYEHSRYPTKHIVEGIIDVFIEHNITDINDIIDNMEYVRIFNPTQQDLCKQMSGVFFNFVCRPNRLLKPMIQTVHDNRLITNTLKNNVQGLITFQNLIAPFNSTNNIKKYPKASERNQERFVLQSRLGESVAFRKPGIRNMVNSTPRNNSRRIQEYKNELTQAMLELEKVDNSELIKDRERLKLLHTMYTMSKNDLRLLKKRIDEVTRNVGVNNQQTFLEKLKLSEKRYEAGINEYIGLIKLYQNKINKLEAPSKKIAFLQREIAKMERQVIKGGNRRSKCTRHVRRM